MKYAWQILYKYRYKFRYKYKYCTTLIENSHRAALKYVWQILYNDKYKYKYIYTKTKHFTTHRIHENTRSVITLIESSICAMQQTAKHFVKCNKRQKRGYILQCIGTGKQKKCSAQWHQMRIPNQAGEAFQ